MNFSKYLLIILTTLCAAGSIPQINAMPIPKDFVKGATLIAGGCLSLYFGYRSYRNSFNIFYEDRQKFREFLHNPLKDKFAKNVTTAFSLGSVGLGAFLLYQGFRYLYK